MNCCPAHCAELNVRHFFEVSYFLSQTGAAFFLLTGYNGFTKMHKSKEEML